MYRRRNAFSYENTGCKGASGKYVPIICGDYLSYSDYP